MKINLADAMFRQFSSEQNNVSKICGILDQLYYLSTLHFWNIFLVESYLGEI